jgi:hypothetical protein
VIFSKTFFKAANNLGLHEASSVLAFVNKFMENPKQPGFHLKRVPNADPFWSARAGSDLRAILTQRDDGNWMVLHIDHHDEAYSWARRRTVETNSQTGSIQIFETVESVRELVPAPRPQVQGLFDAHTDAYLLSLGLPAILLPTVRQIQDEETLLRICDKFPEEVQEALVSLASGELVAPTVVQRDISPELHPDSKRRFWVVETAEELQSILNSSWEEWRIFLHPAQEKLARGTFNGPLKVSGGAGTGKTVVGLHRAKYLAGKGRRVLFTTFTNSLTGYLGASLEKLCTADEFSRIQVSTVHSQALELCKKVRPKMRALPPEEIERRIGQARLELGSGFDKDFLCKEWERVLAPQNVVDWDGYRGARRVGRGQPLSVKERKEVWRVFARVREGLESDNGLDFSGTCALARDLLAQGKVSSPFDAVIVDEMQDLQPQELSLLAALAGPGSDRLTLLGDGGQRIYGGGISLTKMGIETRGRSHTLRINYRTTEQIRQLADQILGDEVDDLDGEREKRKTRSLLRGPKPLLQGCASADEQVRWVLQQIDRCLKDGVKLEEMALFARANHLYKAFEQAFQLEKIPYCGPGKNQAGIRVCSMHKAKGLEFKIVFVADASEKNLPLRSVLEKQEAVDQPDFLEEERRVFYVSLTRARDELFVSWVGKSSPFLEPLLAKVFV